MKRLFVLLVCLFIPLFIGGLAGGLTVAGSGLYQNIALPDFAPPGWVFPAVWTALYTLMGLSSYFAYTSLTGKSGLWKVLYAITLALNFVWPFLFFKWRFYMLSFLVILLMWAVGFVLTREFWARRPVAGILFLPYMGWLSFAAYLSYGVARLN
ncbi:MAG: tryptophan-rich sensory protein [Clostridia bacterium]|nr:tryptophan-rich sensory protein [Clostridia bacterium]